MKSSSLVILSITVIMSCTLSNIHGIYASASNPGQDDDHTEKIPQDNFSAPPLLNDKAKKKPRRLSLSNVYSTIRGRNKISQFDQVSESNINEGHGIKKQRETMGKKKKSNTWKFRSMHGRIQTTPTDSELLPVSSSQVSRLTRCQEWYNSDPDRAALLKTFQNVALEGHVGFPAYIDGDVMNAWNRKCPTPVISRSPELLNTPWPEQPLSDRMHCIEASFLAIYEDGGDTYSIFRENTMVDFNKLHDGKIEERYAPGDYRVKIFHEYSGPVCDKDRLASLVKSNKGGRRFLAALVNADIRRFTPLLSPKVQRKIFNCLPRDTMIPPAKNSDKIYGIVVVIIIQLLQLCVELHVGRRWTRCVANTIHGPLQDATRRELVKQSIYFIHELAQKLAGNKPYEEELKNLASAFALMFFWGNLLVNALAKQMVVIITNNRDLIF